MFISSPYPSLPPIDHLQRLRDTGQGLVLRPDDFPRMLAQIGFGEPVRLGSVGEGGTAFPLTCITSTDTHWDARVSSPG